MMPALVLAACTSGTETTTISTATAATESMAPTTTVAEAIDTSTTTSVVHDIDYRQYVETALSVMEHHYYATDDIDWAAIRQTTLSDLSGDPSPEEAYRVISDALFELADPHSYFLTPERQANIADLPQQTIAPSGEKLERAGYLTLPGVFNWNIDPDDPTAYADAVNQLLTDLDTPDPACGWIVDLRDNGGGAIGPMFASLGPLLGDSVVLTATGPPGTQTISVSDDLTVDYDFAPAGDNPTEDLPLLVDFSLVDSTAEETAALMETTLTPSEPIYETTVEDPPVAVLTSNVTASAAEYVVVALLGRDNIRTFGNTTAGMATAIGGFQFADSGVLGIATLVPSDRQGRSYDTNIVPEDFIGFSPPGEDRPLDAALDWLGEQPSCH